MRTKCPQPFSVCPLHGAEGCCVCAGSLEQRAQSLLLAGGATATGKSAGKSEPSCNAGEGADSLQSQTAQLLLSPCLSFLLNPSLSCPLLSSFSLFYFTFPFISLSSSLFPSTPQLLVPPALFAFLSPTPPLHLCSFFPFLPSPRLWQ